MALRDRYIRWQCGSLEAGIHGERRKEKTKEAGDGAGAQENRVKGIFFRVNGLEIRVGFFKTHAVLSH
jgi:hypothetical protein